MVKGIYSYTVEQRDVDFTGFATYTAAMNYILQAAGDDADINGFGVRDLNHGNNTWVLSRMCVEFGRRLGQGEKIEVRTWVNDVGRMMTTRNMEVRDGQGEVIACVVTQWAVIDMEKRVALDIRSNIDYEGYVSNEPCPMGKPARIVHVRADKQNKHRVVYSDMDFNNHVNAMKYVELMFDMLPLQRISEELLRRIDLNFMHEAVYGQELTVNMENGENGRSLFEITSGEQVICKAAMEWVKTDG